MPFTLTLDDARTELTYLAAIDGKTGSDGRHSPTRLASVINRKYRQLRHRAALLGFPIAGVVQGSSTALPGRLSGEDYQSIDTPATMNDLIGVDVQVNGTWQRLDPASFDQRRNVPQATPPNGVGFWAVLLSPSISGATLSAGKVAVWPTSLTGNYKLRYIDVWTPITTGTDAFLMYEGWDEWLLNAAAMAITQRDANKRDNFMIAQRAFEDADRALAASAPRMAGPGQYVPLRRDGFEI